MRNTKTYAARTINEEFLLRSSSGGMFTVLSDYVLNRGGAVACTIYNYNNHSADYKLIINQEERNSARGSKYMQSIPGTIYKQCENWLLSNPDKEILFVGTGCQVGGFLEYAEMKGFSEKVYAIDMICHGSPSPKLWKEYAQVIEMKNDGKISYLTFKDKRNGWKNPTAFVVVNGKEIPINEYVKLYYSRCDLRPSCHVCPYTTTERKTDMTIGDYWHIEKKLPEFYSEKGNSLVLIHTKRGDDLFRQIINEIDYQLSNVSDCWQLNLEKPTEASNRRVKFWRDYHSRGIEFILRKYGTDTHIHKIRRRIKKISMQLTGGGYLERGIVINSGILTFEVTFMMSLAKRRDAS